MGKSNGNRIVGRVREQNALQAVLESKKSEFLAIYGRRRVGKTYLIRNFFSQTSSVFFHVTGLQKGKLQQQLIEFAKQIAETFYPGAVIQARKRWVDAFEDLTRAIAQIPKDKPVIIFMDELPWMDTSKSGLLTALELYWNRYWVHDNRIKLIVCGSATSWIIQKIINNKGGLHNRVTRTIRLDPFTLFEIEEYLDMMGIDLDHRQILDLYMVLGGIPLYWSFIPKGRSAIQIIDELCFQKSGPLHNEFGRLFESLFDNASIHMNIVRTIAKYRYGIGQADLIVESKMPDGGRTVQRLHELEEAGFIISFIPYGHQDKGIYYKIDDEYSLFYLNWIEPNIRAIKKKDMTEGFWGAQHQLSSWKSWAGYSFEAVCYKHLAQIRRALHIPVGSTAGAWRYSSGGRGDKPGAQIDLLFDRPDGVITICEIKCVSKPFVISKTDRNELVSKMDVFKRQTRTDKQLFLAFVTTKGLKANMYSGFVINQAVLDDFFKEA